MDVYRTIKRGLPDQSITGPHTVLSKHGSNSWLISPAPGSKGTPITSADIHLEPVIPAPELRHSLPEQDTTYGIVVPNTTLPLTPP